MKLSKNTLLATSAALLLSSSIAFAETAPKVSIQKNVQTKVLTGASSQAMTARGKTWHYGNPDDRVIFDANISLTNKSNSVVFTTVEFYNMNIRDDDVLYPFESINKITTNFQFDAIHLILRDSYHDVFFDGNVYPNTHFTIKRVSTDITLGARAATGKTKLELVRE